MNIGKIQRLCKEHGTTISGLEKTLGLGNATICAWQKGNPRVDNLKRVADHFHVTVDYLLTEDE